MQTSVDAEIVVYSSGGQKPGYQILKVQDARQRVVKYKQLSITEESESKVTDKD